MDTGTAGEGINPAPEISETRTAVAVLTEDAGAIRHLARDLRDQTDQLHQSSHLAEWAERTRRRGRSAFSETLGGLAELGFSWRDVARLVGVSVPATQKWRNGEGATAANRQKVAGLLAACDLISEKYHVPEIASWFEIPLLPHVPVTPIDLWSDRRHDLVFDLASGHADAEEILDAWDPRWRDSYRSDFEAFRGGDGQLSLRYKGTDRGI